MTHFISVSQSTPCVICKTQSTYIHFMHVVYVHLVCHLWQAAGILANAGQTTREKEWRLRSVGQRAFSLKHDRFAPHNQCRIYEIRYQRSQLCTLSARNFLHVTRMPGSYGEITHIHIQSSTCVYFVANLSSFNSISFFFFLTLFPHAMSLLFQQNFRLVMMIFLNEHRKPWRSQTSEADRVTVTMNDSWLIQDK